MSRHCVRVGAVLPDPKRQRLEALDKHESIEGRDCRADVAQEGDTRFQNIGNGPQRLYGLGPYCAVVTRVWFVEHWKSVSVLLPVEIASVDDNAADRGAMSADIFCRRVHRDCSTMLDRLAQYRARRVVHDQWNAEIAADFGDFSDRKHAEFRIGQGLPVIATCP